MLPFLVRNADESIRADVAQAAINELNHRIDRRHNNETSSSNQQHLAGGIVGVAANTKPESAQRVVAFARQAATTDSLIATYAQESILARNFDNVFAVSRRWSGHQLDREVFAALCLEGLDPAAKPELKALAHPATRCLAILKGGIAKRSQTKKDLSHLFVGGDGSDARFAEDTREIAYEVFFAALAAELSGGKAQGWSNIPANAQTTWLSEAVRALERLAGCIAERWEASRHWPALQDIYSAFELQQPTSPSHDVWRRFIAVRLALRDIAIDLCTIAKGLDSNALISMRDIESVAMSPFWLDALWLDSFTERRLPLHTPEAAQALVERIGHDLDTKITEFNERTTDSAKLSMFALDNGIIPLAHKELRRAVGCLLGYGWRKDLFALEVLESLDLLAKNGDVDSREAILALAGEFEAITDYTDGDETDHVREEFYKAIVAHFPERAPDCYSHLIRDEEWSYAETLAITLAETDHVESRTGRALLESYIAPREFWALERVCSACRPYTNAALTAVQLKTGRAIEATSDQKESTPAENLNSIDDDSESGETELSIPNPSEFPPERLQEYLNATRDVRPYDHKRKLVTEWLRHWEGAGRTEEALTSLETETSKTKYHPNLDNALDVAFEIALKAQGRSKAFPWLVRAHVTRSGWQQWFTNSDEAQARMRTVALHYRGQWQEFIKNTTKPVFSTRIEGNGIVIGLSRLVYFLVEVGELDLAQTYALEMARIFKEELTDQPIKTPEWSR